LGDPEIVRLTPADTEGLRDIALVVEPQVMASLSPKAIAFRKGEVEARDCFMLKTEVGLWGYERAETGAIWTVPVEAAALSQRCPVGT